MVAKDCDEAGTIMCLFSELAECDCPLAVLCDDGTIVTCDDPAITEDDCKAAECELEPEMIYVLCGKDFGETVQCVKEEPGCENFGSACGGMTIKKNCEPTDGPTKFIDCEFGGIVPCDCPTVATCDDDEVVECPALDFPTPEECKDDACSGDIG